MITYHAPCIQSCTFGLYSYELCDVPMYPRKYKSSWYAVRVLCGHSMSVYSAKCSLTLANTSSDGTLLKIGSDDYTHNYCELLATVSTPIYSVMLTPTMQYTRYLHPEDDQSIWSKRRQGFQLCCEAGIGSTLSDVNSL